MKIFRGAEAPSGPGDPKTFTGAVHTTRLASDDTGTPAHVYRVAFEPGARTYWHTHSGPQWLFVIEGRIRAKAASAPAVDLIAGDAVVIAPGERHWHGATPDARGVHLAVNVDATTTWLEPVSDTDYVS
jgi:quercetin dioxygenase-like cupin family protein